MKKIKYNCFLILSCLAFVSSAQCSFQYISNDTVFQDYIEFIYPRKNSNEITAIGSRISRGFTNDSVFNAPFFQIFDNCGQPHNKTIYRYIGNYQLRHEAIPTHNTYKEEPIGNTAINANVDEFFLADKAIDTILKKPVMILFKINEKGELINFKTLSISIEELNQNVIKNVLQLKDGRVLIISWDGAFEYFFYYFDENFDFLYQKSFNLGRGIRSIKEDDHGEFICTSLAYDKTSFQVYKLDSNGEIKWLMTPYNIFGSARDIVLKNNRIYVVGGITGFGVFLICDFEGNLLKEFKYDTFYCQPQFCSTYVGSDNSFIIGGYVKHCESADKRGSDVAIVKIDTNGAILWNRLYDFRNDLGTSGDGGYYMDYGGFVIAKDIDGGIFTNGMSRYSSSSPGMVLHEDALLIKTESMVITNTDQQIKNGILQFKLLANLINYNLYINGPLDLIKNWFIYSLQGVEVHHGSTCSGQINVISIKPGMCTLKIMDRNNYPYLFKFIKI